VAHTLTSEVLKIMLIQKLMLASAGIIALGLTAWTASAALGIGNGSQMTTRGAA
jgi:hypothetical protein